MEKNNYPFTLLLFLITTLTASAQEAYHALYLSDKAGTIYSVDQPQEFLSERSLQRRLKQGIDIRTSDLPVSADYVAQISSLGLEVVYTSKWLNAVLVKATLQEVAEVEDLSFVLSSEYLAPLSGQNTSGIVKDDSRLFTNYSRNLRAQEDQNQNQNNMLGIPRMHELGFRGEGMMIAVLDGGFTKLNDIEAFAHLFEEGQVVSERNFTAFGESIYQYSNHGTKVSSTISGLLPGEYTGIAPKASFVFCVTEVSKSEYKIEEFYWLVGAEFADSIGVDIINSSLGYYDFDDISMDYTYEDMDGQTTIITRAASNASDVGMIVVTSVGNEGSNSWNYLTAPADAEFILAVGSTDASRNKSPFSSFGPSADGRIKPDVSCLGGPAITIDGNGIGATSGTSLSAPQIAGLAAGLWQALPELTNLEIMDLIRNAGSQSDAPDNELGYGIPTFSRAYGEMLGLDNLDQLKDIIIYPNPVTNNLINLKMANGENLGSFSLQILDAQGREVFTTFGKHLGQFAQVQIPTLSKGMYMVKVNTGSFGYSSRLLKK